MYLCSSGVTLYLKGPTLSTGRSYRKVVGHDLCQSLPTFYRHLLLPPLRHLLDRLRKGRSRRCPSSSNTRSTHPDRPYGKRSSLSRSRYMRSTFLSGSIPYQNRVYPPYSLRLCRYHDRRRRSRRRSKRKGKRNRRLCFRRYFMVCPLIELGSFTRHSECPDRVERVSGLRLGT